MGTVLVVDDDTDLLEMISLVLASNGIKVNCLNNGNDFWNFLSDNSPDVVLMDIFLGDLDGRELCRTIKSSQRFKYIPVILYSAGQVTPASIEDSLADDFISKPFDIVQLIRKIGLLIHCK